MPNAHDSEAFNAIEDRIRTIALLDEPTVFEGR